ncbi:MAG TPA: TonB-dependent receptor [Gemmatimonadales bacterium]|nr:TonB-dependent receptor [Gemmatimonadales bacterium]
MSLSVFGLLLALQAPQAAPASSGATLAGEVRNGATGDPLPGALVTLLDLDRIATADSVGRYRFPDVPAGPQHLSFRLIGYVPRTLHALVPAAGELTIHVALEPAPLRLPTVEVRPPIAIRGLEPLDSTHFPDRGSSMAAAWNHPLLAEPDALHAIGGGEVTARPEAPSGLHVRGGAADHTGYLLDGIPVFSPYHAGGVFSAWNPDALAGLQLSAAAPPPAYPHALSGSVSAATRAPGVRFGARGAVSSTQARLTLDGPIVGGAGYLVSIRSSFPSLAPGEDPSYLRGGAGDRLVKLEAPVLGGRARILGYDAEDELDAARRPVESGVVGGRNAFEWHSRSFGAEWIRPVGRSFFRAAVWQADADAESDWGGGAVGGVNLTSTRTDLGLLASLEHATPGGTTLLGVRVERSATSYRVAAESGAENWEAAARTPYTTAFARHSRTLGPQILLDVGMALTAGRGEVHAGPRAQLRWEPAGRVAVTASYARLHQFAQSLRNPESIVGTVFPADLYLGAGAAGVPVARSDQAIVAAEYRPAAPIRLGVQGFARSFDGLLLVAPTGDDPFAISTGGATPFTVGSGTSRGFAIDAALTAARLGLVASYGYQRVRLRSAVAADFVPDYGTPHVIDAGVILFPAPSTSFRLGVTAGWGRRTTGVVGGFEWESCNLLDRGCEFAGTPQQTGLEPGAVSLPGYARVDLGFRQHWHIGLGSREVILGLFGTVTNLLGRANVLTVATDPLTGEALPVGMRSLGPLVVGLDWRF